MRQMRSLISRLKNELEDNISYYYDNGELIKRNDERTDFM